MYLSANNDLLTLIVLKGRFRNQDYNLKEAQLSKSIRDLLHFFSGQNKKFRKNKGSISKRLHHSNIDHDIYARSCFLEFPWQVSCKSHNQRFLSLESHLPQ